MNRLNSLKRLTGFSLKKNSYSEKLIKEATNDTNWGPTTIELNELSQLSCHDRDLQIINKKLNKELKSKNPVQILKALTIVHFILETGSSKFYKWFKSNEIYTIKCLVEYQCNTEKNEELANTCKSIRAKAIEIFKMLESKDYLMTKRQDFRILRRDMKSPTPRSSLDLLPSNLRVSTNERQSKSSDYGDSSRVNYLIEYNNNDPPGENSFFNVNNSLNNTCNYSSYDSDTKNNFSNSSSDNAFGQFTNSRNNVTTDDNYGNSYKLKKLDNIMETEEDDLSDSIGLPSNINSRKMLKSEFVKNASSVSSRKQLSSNNPFRTMV